MTLLEAMRAAEMRDRIAWNYAHGFADIFTLGLEMAGARARAMDEPSSAVTRVYLGFLAHLPDTLIERKFGTRTAALVREEAGPIEASFTECPAPEAMTAPLAAFDQALKGRGLNPGTSADLTVAALSRPLSCTSTAQNEAEKRSSSRRTIDLPIFQPPAYVLPAEL